MPGLLYYQAAGSISFSAAGSSQATATELTGTFNTVTDADGTKGVVLPIPFAGDSSQYQPIYVYNSDATNNLKLYPPVGGAIDSGSANASITLVPGETRLVIATSTTVFRTVSLPQGTLDGVTAGTVTASKAVVVDANKDIASFRNVTGVNFDAGASGTAGTVDVFPTTASKGKLTLAAVDSTGNTTTTISNVAMGQAVVVSIPDGGASTDTFLTAKSASAISSTLTQTSASASSIKSGRQGATNPGFQVDNSAGTAVGGVKVTASATGVNPGVSAISSDTNSTLGLDGQLAGGVNIGATSTGLNVMGRGSLKAPIQANTKTTGNAQNVTPLAAELLGGLYSHNSQTGAGTVTLDTAGNLDTAIAGVATGDSFECYYHNVGNQTATITTNTGLTLKGATVAIVTLKGALLKFVRTGAAAWDVYILAGA